MRAAATAGRTSLSPRAHTLACPRAPPRPLAVSCVHAGRLWEGHLASLSPPSTHTSPPLLAWGRVSPQGGRSRESPRLLPARGCYLPGTPSARRSGGPLSFCPCAALTPLALLNLFRVCIAFIHTPILLPDSSAGLPVRARLIIGTGLCMCLHSIWPGLAPKESPFSLVFFPSGPLPSWQTSWSPSAGKKRQSCRPRSWRSL